MYRDNNYFFPVRGLIMHPAVLLSDNDRFHYIRIDYFDRVLINRLQEDHIIQDDSFLISAFIAERKITNNISIRRTQKITSNLITFRRGKISQYFY